jgi:taurine dioxygenase
MELTRITGVLGAVVDGVDVRTASDSGIEELKQALAQHQVLILRGQELSEEDLIAAAARFGEPFKGDTRGEALSRIENSETKAPATDGWHADSTFLANPPYYGLLRAEHVPPFGGDTVWTSLYAAFEALSPGMQDLASSLSARHAMTDAYIRAAKASIGVTPDAAFHRVETNHPLVLANPITGRRSLYLCPAYLANLVGVSESESSALLELFNNYLDRPAFQLRWSWTPNDLAIWDERAVVHRGLSDHFYDGPQYRLMKHVLALGEAPLAAATSDTA